MPSIEVAHNPPSWQYDLFEAFSHISAKAARVKSCRDCCVALFTVSF